MRKDLKKGISKNRLILFFIIFSLLQGCFGQKNPDNIFNSAIKLWSEGEYSKSIKQFESFIDLYPDHPLSPKASFWIGDLHYIYLNDPKKALYDYALVVKRYIKSEYASKAQWKIATILSDDLVEKGQGIKEYQLFIKLFPNHPLVPKAQYNIAEAYAYLEDYQQAITEFELFLEKYPDTDITLQVLNRLGELYCLVGIYPRAVEYLNKAYELSEEVITKSQIKRILAECYASQGELSKSLSTYEEILTHDPNNLIIINRIDSLKNRLRIMDKTQKYQW